MKKEILREGFYTVASTLTAIGLIGLANTFGNTSLLGCAGLIAPVAIASGVGLRNAIKHARNK